MRGVRRETLEPLKGVFQTAQGQVKNGGQLAEFIGGVLDRKTFGKALRAYSFGFAGHGGDRLQDPAGQHIASQGRKNQRAREERKQE